MSPAVDETVVANRLRACGSVFAEDEARVLVASAATPIQLETMVQQRLEGTPLEHVVGWVEFCGQRFTVDVGVFVPRRRTELLARRAAALTRPSAVVVDLCCGCGAVGAAVAASVPGVELHAVDVDATAVACARRNVAAVDGRVYGGDLYAPLPTRLVGHVDVLVANVPYVPTDHLGSMPPEARRHEPRIALDGGAGGLDVVRRVSAHARRWLVPGGHLVVESSQRQAVDVARAFARDGLTSWVARAASLDATVVVGTAP